MENYILECCVDSVESAINAAKGGANRLELCSNLIIGGTSPDVALFRQVRKETNVRVHALIRPRFGDFYYSRYEMEIMKEQIRNLREAGVEGFVIGVLDEEGNLNKEAMKELIKEAGDCHIVLHRAFDMCCDPFQTMEEAIELGVKTILTSGQQQSAWEGRELLSKLIERANGRIDIMAGSGIGAVAIKKLLPITKGSSYHMSGKVTLDSPMKYRKKEVSMGLSALSEYEIWQTSEENVRVAVNVLKEYYLDE